MERNLLTLLVAALAALLAPPTTARAGEVGMNVTAPAYWAGDWPFVDLVRSASDWRVATDDEPWTRIYDAPAYRDGTVALTEDGYPTVAGADWSGGGAGVRAFRTLVPGGNEAAVGPGEPGYLESPVGTYTLFARGTGRLTLSGGGFAPTTLELTGGPARAEVERTPGTAAEGPERFGLIEIVATDAADPVRDVHLVMPGHAETFERRPFHPLFLERLRPFAGVRLMDWSNVNGSPVRRWADRPPAAWFSYASAARQVRTDAPEFADRRPLLPAWAGPSAVPIGGVPLEVQAALARELDCDLWVCLPALADDDYVARAVRLLRDEMPEGRTLIVEWANETWNRAFLPDRLARAAVGDVPWGERDKLFDWTARRFAAAYAAARAELGDRDDVRYVVPVETAAAYLALADAPRVDAAIANFYWGIEWTRRAFEEGWIGEPDDALLDRMEATAIDELRGKLTTQRAEVERLSAEHYPLAAWAYEGGAHFQGIWWRDDVQKATGETTRRLLRHPRMAGLYGRMFDALRDAGFTGKNCLFANAGGEFGHLAHPTADPQASARYRAAVEAASGE